MTAFYRGVRFSSVLSFAPSATVLFTNCLTVSHRRPLQLRGINLVSHRRRSHLMALHFERSTVRRLSVFRQLTAQCQGAPIPLRSSLSPLINTFNCCRPLPFPTYPTNPAPRWLAVRAETDRVHCASAEFVKLSRFSSFFTSLTGCSSVSQVRQGGGGD